jgi:hypothetical protein
MDAINAVNVKSRELVGSRCGGTGILTETQKTGLAKARGCPVNRKTPVKMRKSTFLQMCINIQKNCGLLKTKGGAVISISGNFHHFNKRVCRDCKIGSKIRNGEIPDKFPVGVSFFTKKELNSLGLKDEIKEKVNPRIKMTADMVREIRRMRKGGISVPEIHKKFDNCSLQTIYDVARGRTWKNIK